MNIKVILVGAITFALGLLIANFATKKLSEISSYEI